MGGVIVVGAPVPGTRHDRNEFGTHVLKHYSAAGRGCQWAGILNFGVPSMAEAVMENGLAVDAHAIKLDMPLCQDPVPEHIRNLHCYSRRTAWHFELVLAGNEVALALGRVGQGDIEDVAVVDAIDHDAVDHGAPVVDLRRRIGRSTGWCMG